MLIKAGVEIRIPEDLRDKIVIAACQLSDVGLALKEVKEVVQIIEDNYWRDKNADKSGG
jgi:hypothetical protein